jgi:hypothetical protein
MVRQKLIDGIKNFVESVAAEDRGEQDYQPYLTALFRVIENEESATPADWSSGKKALKFLHAAVLGMVAGRKKENFEKKFKSLTRIIHDFGDNESLLWYKHVEMTMF